MRRFFGSVAALAVLTAAPALSADFGALDTNDDSLVDRAEFDAAYGDLGLFESADRDRDLKVNTEEIAGVRYAGMDLDGDSTVTVGEWRSWVEQRYPDEAEDPSPGDWDENDDGVISRVEFDEEVARHGRFRVSGTDEPVSYGKEEFGDWLYGYLDLDGDARLSEEELRIDSLGM